MVDERHFPPLPALRFPAWQQEYEAASRGTETKRLPVEHRAGFSKMTRVKWGGIPNRKFCFHCVLGILVVYPPPRSVCSRDWREE